MNGEDPGVRFKIQEERFHSLLPAIAGVLECMHEVSPEQLHKKVQKNTSRRLSKKEVLSGLEHGVRLGLFDVKREYRISSQLKEAHRASKKARTQTLRFNSFDKERKKRGRSSRKCDCRSPTSLASTSSTSQGSCMECPVKPEELREGKSRGEKCTENKDEERQRDRSPSKSKTGPEMQEKDRLLVNKSSFQTEPPYCDIFT